MHVHAMLNQLTLHEKSCCRLNFIFFREYTVLNNEFYDELYFQYVAVAVNPDQVMSFGGSTDPCAVCFFGNIGRINNKEFSKQVTDKISKELNIASGR